MEYPIHDNVPFRGSLVFSLQAELHFIDTLGSYSPVGRRVPRETLLHGYLEGLERRTRDFASATMTPGTKDMLRQRARMHLHDISLADAA